MGSANGDRELFKDKDDFVAQYREACETFFAKKYDELSQQERFYVLAGLIANKSRNLKVDSHKDDKEVYYFSLEFLLGPCSTTTC